MVDGPYGGCSVDPSAFETVLFVSGGSGATFTIGLLDELVGKCLKRTSRVVTRKIEVVWYIRSFGENICDNRGNNPVIENLDRSDTLVRQFLEYHCPSSCCMPGFRSSYDDLCDVLVQS